MFHVFWHFELRNVFFEQVYSKSLATIIQLVINASPKLKEVTIPLGFCPDLENLKCLEVLRISLNRAEPIHLEGWKLLRMLAQVGEQLVTLTFGYVGRNGSHSAKLLLHNGNPTAIVTQHFPPYSNCQLTPANPHSTVPSTL